MLSFRPLRWLAVAIVVMAVGHVTGLITHSQLGWDRTTGVLREFDLNAEGNLASWFESFLLLCVTAVAVMLFLAAREQQNRHTRRWALLAGVLMLMTVDEAAQLHDMTAVPIRDLLGVDKGSPLYFAWIIPALLFLLVVAVYLVPLLTSLPVASQARLLVAAAVYFGGAVGIEALSGFAVSGGRQSTPYHVVTTLEEVVELIGAWLALAALLEILERLHPTLVLQVSGRTVSTTVLHDDTAGTPATGNHAKRG